jgi:hypothetical protein
MVSEHDTTAPSSAGSDLLWIVDRAAERASELLEPAEHAVLETLRELPPPVRSAFARRVRRVHAVQPAESPYAAALVAHGLADGEVSWSARAHHATVAELKAGARRLGLRVGGRRAELVARLAPHEGWSDRPWIRVRHRELVRRLDRFAFLHRWPDPARPVVQRLGHVVFPRYEVGRCPPLFPSRPALLRWEALAAAVEQARAGEAVEPEVLVAALEAGDARAPGALDLTGSVVRVLVDVARQLERASEPARAQALYERVLPFARSPLPVVVRVARCLEAQDRLEAAWRVLDAHRTAEGPHAMGLHRAGRRVGKRVRRGWAPPAPRPPLVERSVPLPSAGGGRRPLFGAGLPVEPATIALLAEVGRTAIHAEGALWRHLYGLCLAPDAYFVPVGQLPAHYLSGPLDVGSPAFRERRDRPVAHVLAEVRAGRAAALVRRCHERFAGTRLAGVGWRDLDADLALVDAVGPALLHRVLEILLARGWRATAGMPDLLVLPGPEVRLPGAMPGRLAPHTQLAELKTPTDTLSDAQRWWIERLEPVVPVEVWHIRPVAGPGRLP